MNQIAKPVSLVGAVLHPAELDGSTLLQALAAHPDKALVFHYDGCDVRPSYHVTEVKTGAFQALDCGANYESWQETFIQLWDVPPEDDRGIMPVGKFLAIIGKVAEAVPFDAAAKVTFEVSDGRRAMQLYHASGVEAGDDLVRVVLTQRPASCKPRDRWLEAQSGEKASCCAPKVGARCCN